MSDPFLSAVQTPLHATSAGSEGSAMLHHSSTRQAGRQADRQTDTYADGQSQAEKGEDKSFALWEFTPSDLTDLCLFCFTVSVAQSWAAHP